MSVGCGSRDLHVSVAPTFSSIEATTISSKCLQCHQSLSTYGGVMEIVTAGKPGESQLYKQINSGGMPQWSPKLSDSEITAVYDWITAGAPND